MYIFALFYFCRDNGNQTPDTDGYQAQNTFRQKLIEKEKKTYSRES